MIHQRVPTMAFGMSANESAPMNDRPAPHLLKPSSFAQDAARITIPAGTRFGHRGGRAGIRKSRIVIEAFAGVSLAAGLHLFVAPNGSGKTTLMRTLAGLIPALSGRAEVAGRVHYVSDQMQLDDELSADDVFRAWVWGSAHTLALDMAQMLGLNTSTPIGDLSLGNRRKVPLILVEVLAAHSSPSVLLLDEPFAGMDAQTRESIAELWATSASAMLRLVVLHELESIQKADSLLSVAGGQLLHASSQIGGSWMETCNRLRTS